MSKRILISVWIVMVAGAVYAQPYASRLGRFQVDQIKGCAPLTITLTNLLAGDCTPGKPCVMDYEGNSTNQQNQFTHTYTTPGTYKLSVLYQSIGSDDITITVIQNIQPNFEIYACAANNARIKVVDTNYEQYVIDFNNDGTPENILPFSNNITTPSHAYAPPGAYVTSVRGRNVGYADNCTAKTQPFNTLNVLPAPVMNTLTSVDASNIKLDFTTAPNIQYKMEIAVNNSTTFQFYQFLYGVNTLTVPSLKLADNFYCFRIGAFDPCNNTTTYSATVCSSKFTATAISDSDQLAWVTSSSSVTNYTISRNGAAYFTTVAQSFNDTSPNIICKTDYCYRITTNYAGGAKSISLEKCVTAFSNKIPTLINDASAVVSAGGVDLSWSQDPAFTAVTYNILRSSNKGAYNALATSPVPKYGDGSYTTADKFCYKVNYADKCDNVSPPGTQICPVRLTGAVDNANVITLHWSAYSGWKSGVKNYVLEKYSLSGTLLKSTTLTDSTFVDDVLDLTNQFVKYRVRAIPNDPLLASVSNDLDLIKNANLFHPTAFTPNGDNLNDRFIVTGQYIVSMNMKVFDRWGALIFATEKNEGWNGTKDGKAISPGIYVWKVEISDVAGRTFSKEGTVALILP